MADIDSKLGEMATETGALLRSAMEGSRDLSLDQAIREPDCHGSIITSRDLELLVFCDKHHEPAVQHDDADHSRHGCLVRPLSNWHGSDHRPHDPKGPRMFQGRLAYICKFIFGGQANKVTLEFAHLANYLAQGGKLPLGPFLLGHIYQTLHAIIIDGMKMRDDGPLTCLPKLRGTVMTTDTESLVNAFTWCPRKHSMTTLCSNSSTTWSSALGHNFEHLYCGLTKARAKVYLSNHEAKQFGLVKEALWGALTNTYWDPIPHKKSRGRRDPAENLAPVLLPTTAAQRRPTTPIPSSPSIFWPTSSVPSPPLTSSPRIPTVDQLSAPLAEPDVEGATS
ncbi:PREDICTED: LOC110752168 [Prunus dulcis]|uniref:PREDICTED: LOC110752168 n=1 Tax=Prunus dulcis TaxID=3755 RepID=A0A5E4GKV0_PRUDU|nr:PREDICTED: LOC110752168 [Prunus dulcis]